MVISGFGNPYKKDIVEKIASERGLVIAESKPALDKQFFGKMDFYEEASIVIGNAISAYKQDSQRENAVIPYHPAEQLSIVELKLLRLDPLSRAAVQQLLAKAYDEIKALKKPDILVYLAPVDADPESRWLGRKLFSIFEEIIGLERVVLVTKPLDKIGLKV
uniref:Uncharacterized protein n=1 Tax=Fervidicoccus fontis TaxID=683846 RepID=A0A7C1E2E9_9CREN